MQTLRRLILLVCLAASSAHGADLVVATWNLKWFPSGGPLRASEEAESERIRAAAAALRALDPDIVLLQEVRDFEACHRLATATGGLKVAICSRFREVGGGPGWQQVAILAGEEAVAVWSEEWKTEGKVGPPRGFAFAHLRYGTHDVAVYSLHLKSNLAPASDERARQLNLLKRELATEQLVRHLRVTEQRLKEQFEAVVVGGDFNTHPDQFPSETTLQALSSAGFRSGFEGLPAAERITRPANGGYPDATFDYLFVRGFRVANRPLIVPTTLSDHRLVARVLRLP